MDGSGLARCCERSGFGWMQPSPVRLHRRAGRGAEGPGRDRKGAAGKGMARTGKARAANAAGWTGCCLSRCGCTEGLGGARKGQAWRGEDRRGKGCECSWFSSVLLFQVRLHRMARKGPEGRGTARIGSAGTGRDGPGKGCQYSRRRTNRCFASCTDAR
jgi:hypothetical protein